MATPRAATCVSASPVQSVLLNTLEKLASDTNVLLAGWEGGNAAKPLVGSCDHAPLEGCADAGAEAPTNVAIVTLPETTTLIL